MVLFLDMPQKKYDAFEHASHNLKAHNYLKKSTEFPDWEITTVFYCSLKFFEGSLFPNTYLHPGKEEDEVKREFNSYNEYKQVFHRFCKGNPHDIMKRFVKYNTNDDVWSSYNDLYDVCHNSRYKNYMVAPLDLEMAKKSLDLIKNYCNANLS